MAKEYYDTLNESSDALKTSKDKAVKQKDQIFAIFRHTLRPMTPTEVWENWYKSKNVPITSIRRAISNLENEGSLEKTDIQKPGMYGKSNHCWIYKEKTVNNDDQLNLL